MDRFANVESRAQQTLLFPVPGGVHDRALRPPALLRQLAERLAQTTGGRLPFAVFAPSGTESVDLALKALFQAADEDSATGGPDLVRGIYPTMYATRPWTIRQYAGFGTAAETNKRYRYLLDSGQTGLSVAFDLPTQMGYDPGDDMATGEVGKAGVSIALADDVEELTLTGDYAHVVNAYEPHDHVYEELLRRPATVVVRGSGIVAMLNAPRSFQDGREPPHLVKDPAKNHFPHIGSIAEMIPADANWRQYFAHLT